MKFSAKIVLCSAIPAVLFAIGLATAITALMATRTQFDNYISTEQALERSISEMYAQGLQMGQALRNVVLDPSNKKGVENFQAAQTAYDKAFEEAKKISASNNSTQSLAELPRLRTIHAQSQEKIVAILKDKGDAAPVLNAEETPAWRNLRAELLKQRDEAGKRSAQEHANVNSKVSFTVTLSLILAVLAGLVAVFLNFYCQKTLHKELGGDPAQARNALSNIAKGNLAQTIDNNAGDDSLMGVLQEMQTSLESLVNGVRGSASGIAQATSEIASGSMDLSNRTESQASSLEETAASMEELNSTVNHNADSARMANQLAAQASAVASRGGEVVEQVVGTMRGINESSQKIQDIIGVIDGIAFQTNILALNAAVEAARAGEQGRGFAVVASEVRSLAGRSAEAAKEIKSLIGKSVEAVGKGTQQVDLAGSTMEEVVSAIRKVSEIVAQISASSAEQSTGVSQVGEAVTLMDQTTQQNAALVEQMAAAATSLNEQSGELMNAVSVFRTRQSGGVVRAAR
ncbi:methyl-accepting chemotaxis protein [Undibacterium sp. JH2W]|uniref:methyl-accepting chemotaxis protein n=1 Tax=Undibacterium sp. JH2W TaxID=3413037 RepID=UPI003BF21498